MSNYPQFPDPRQQPHGPQQDYPGPNQPQNPYGGPPQTPKKNYLWLKIAAPIVVVLVLALIIASGIIHKRKSAEDKDTGVMPSLEATRALPSSKAEPNHVEIPSRNVKSSEVFRDSSMTDELSAPQGIMPGAKYMIMSADDGILKGSCSFGWMVAHPSEPDEIYNLTAGHCGEEGDLVFLPIEGEDHPESYVPIGHFVFQDFTDDQLYDGEDYALVKFDPDVNPFISYTPGAADGFQIVGATTGADLKKDKPYTCHLGFRSGLSCGPFQNVSSEVNFAFNGITDHGDSGGVIWSFAGDDSSKISAIGIVSWVDFDVDAATTNGKLIAPFLERLGLQLITG